MKKLLCTILILLSVFFVLPAHAEEDNAWRTAYASVYVKNVQKTFLADIDLDNTPELWMLVDGFLSVYTYKDGQVQAVPMQPTSYKAADAQIILIKRKNGGYAWRVDLMLKEGGTSSSRYYADNGMVRFTDIFRNTGESYYHNGKKVTKSYFNAKKKVFDKNYSVATYTTATGASIPMVLSMPYFDVPTIYPTKIKPKKTKLTLSKGATHQLSYTLSPSYCTGRHLTFTSSDETVLRVEEDNTLTALSVGKAVVTVTADNEVSARVTVTVTAPKPLTVSVISETGETSLLGKQTMQLSASVYPADATQYVTWSSSKKSIATVTASGLVKGVKAGTATITARASNGKKGTFKVKVIKPVSVTGVEIPVKYQELSVGQIYDLSCTIYPENATNRTVIWNTNDENIATVNEDGIVTGISVGETVITATSANGHSASCAVRVYSGNGVTRRAFLLGTGNNDYISSTDIDDPEQKMNEVLQISQMLQRQNFPTEIEIYTMVNPYRASTALNAIANAFTESDEDDVNYIYIVCHGSNPYSGEYELSIGTHGGITAAELRDALQNIRGTFYIFIEACYSGDLIGKGASFDPEAFVASFSGGLTSKRGEMADEKFHIYCSGSSSEQSTYFWVDKDRNMSIFGYALATAGGWEPALYEETSRSVSLAADADKNGCVTDAELRVYMSEKIRSMSKKKQTLCVWPKEADSIVLFRKDTK